MVVNIKDVDSDKLITCDDVLGKEVIDPKGEVLGISIKLHIDKELKELVGITIDQGFMKPELFVGIKYIKKFGKNAVFLNETPLIKIIGMDVITAEGNYIGVVKDIIFDDKNRIKVLKIVQKGKGIIPKIMELNSSDIKEIKYSVILKKGII